MTTFSDIYNAIDKIAPFSSAMDFDNVGILVGDREAEADEVLIALDITNDVIDEMINKGIKLAISHHPVIFDPIKVLSSDSIVYRLASLGMSVLSCHTNLDISEKWGTNATLSEFLMLNDIIKTEDCLFTGTLSDSTTVAEYASYLNEAFASVSYIPADKRIKRIGFCSGSGGDFITEAMCFCDAFVTGEAHHDELISAANKGFPVFVLGHYETEKPFAVKLKKYLDGLFPDTEFVLSEAEKNPVIKMTGTRTKENINGT